MNHHHVLKRLSAVHAERTTLDIIASGVYRETDIRMASEALFKSAVRLQAIPRLPEVADYRAAELERFEAAIKIMREAISE